MSAPFQVAVKYVFALYYFYETLSEYIENVSLIIYNYCTCLLNIFRIKEEGKIRNVEIHANSKQFQLTKTLENKKCVSLGG